MVPIQNFEQHARKFMEPDLRILAVILYCCYYYCFGFSLCRSGVRIVIYLDGQLLSDANKISAGDGSPGQPGNIAHLGVPELSEELLPGVSAILMQLTKPQATDSVEHKLRNVIIEILNRLPHSEVLRPFVQDLLKVAMHVLTTDNEENGLICMRIIFDLLRNYRPTLENEVQPFLDFVKQIYQNFRATVSYFFDDSGGNDNQMAANQHAVGYIGAQRPPGGPIPGQLNPSTRSFKIVTECPLIVMFLFQLYSRYVQTNIPVLLPLMVSAISIPGPQHVPPNLKNHYVELKGAQVKTVSFLTYLLRSFADYIRPHEENISKSIVNLLVSCPDSVSIRKELLVATRHVLATDFRRGFFQLIDTLSEERLLNF